MQVGMSNCTNDVSRTYDALGGTTRSKSGSDIEIDITRSVFITASCTALPQSESVAQGTSFCLAEIPVLVSVWKIISGWKRNPFGDFQNPYFIHGFNLTPDMKTRWQFYSKRTHFDSDVVISYVTARLSILASIFMFRSGSFRRQVLRAISRVSMQISHSYFQIIGDSMWSQQIGLLKIAGKKSRSEGNQATSTLKWPQLRQFWSIEMRWKLKCRACLWLCQMVIKSEDSLNLTAECQST